MTAAAWRWMVSVVIPTSNEPVSNEEVTLSIVFPRLTSAPGAPGRSSEIILVENRGRDRSIDVLRAEEARDPIASWWWSSRATSASIFVALLFSVVSVLVAGTGMVVQCVGHTYQKARGRPRYLIRHVHGVRRP